MQPEHGTGLELPTPDADSTQHSGRVAEHIRLAIEAAGGSISFAEFMQHALYTPGLGYYTAGTKKFGGWCANLNHACFRVHYRISSSGYSRKNFKIKKQGNT